MISSFGIPGSIITFVVLIGVVYFLRELVINTRKKEG